MFRARTWSALLLVSESGELMYAEKKGQRMIHRNYLNWVLNLVNDTNRNLVLVQS